MITNNDTKLWNRFLKGDSLAYAQIYKAYSQALYAYGMCFTSNSEVVEDAIHDVFVKIYQNRENIGETNNIKLYLFVALKNTLYNLFRGIKHKVEFEDEESYSMLEGTIESRIVEDEEADERKNRIRKMIDTLSPKQKEIIYYRYLEDMTIDQISKLLKMNLQSTRNLLHRSLKKLRTTFC